MLVRPKSQTILRMGTNDAGVTISLAFGLQTMMWTKFFENRRLCAPPMAPKRRMRITSRHWRQTTMMRALLAGAKIHQNLANIIGLKRWGIFPSSDKLKPLLGKHGKPENCADITVAKGNPKIWSQMNNFKHKDDLRLGNVQQALQKHTFGLLKSCDTLVPKQDSVSRKNSKPEYRCRRSYRARSG